MRSLGESLLGRVSRALRPGPGRLPAPAPDTRRRSPDPDRLGGELARPLDGRDVAIAVRGHHERGCPDLLGRSVGDDPTGLHGGAWAPALLLLALLAVVAVATGADFRPPGPAPADAPDDVFSAARAQAHLAEFAQVPHAVGSADHGRVRDYLIDSFEGLGLEVRVQVATMDDRPTMHNLLARIEGTDDTGAVLVVTHYDSVPSGPGAGDAGIATASVLETARALLAGPPPRNDVILLLTDGEEAGLIGADYFVSLDPWAADVARIVNFDARGTNGPVFMFEMSRTSIGLLREYASVAPRPYSNSLLPEAVGIAPNSTDMEVFHRLGVPGVNFAIAGNSVYYHTPGDNLAHADPATIQLNGDTMLAMARHFAAVDVSDRAADGGRAVWVSLTSRFLLVYPTSVVLPLLVVVLAAFAGLVWAARAGAPAGTVRLRRIALGLVFVPLTIVAAFALTTALLALIRILHPQYLPHLPSALPNLVEGSGLDLPRGQAYWWAFVVATGSLTTALLGGARRWCTAAELTIVGLGLWTALTALVSLTLPGGSYLFVLPTLPCLLGAGYWLRVERGPTSWRGAVVLAVSAVPALLVLVGLLRFLYSTKLSNAAPMMGIVALLGFLLVPQLEVGRAVSRRALPGGLAFVAAALVVVGGLTAEVDPLSFRPWSEVGTPDPDLPATSRPVDLGDDLPRASRAALVTYESGRQCVELGDATRSDAEGRTYWCPLRDDLAPPLDFQRAEIDDRVVLFGGVCTDVAEVHITGPGTDVVIVPTVVGDRRLFAYAAPATREPPERPIPDEGGRVDVVAVDTGGRELARTVGLDLRPPDDTWYEGSAGAPAVVRNVNGC